MHMHTLHRHVRRESKTCTGVDPVSQVPQMRSIGRPTPLAWSTKPVRPQALLAVAATLSAPRNLATAAQVVARSERGHRTSHMPTIPRHRRHVVHSHRPGTSGCGTANAYSLRLCQSWSLDVCLTSTADRASGQLLVPPAWPCDRLAQLELNAGGLGFV